MDSPQQPERTNKKEIELNLRLALIPILTGWAKVAPGRNPEDRVDVDVVEIYAESLAEIRIRPHELESARRSLLRTNRFFPTVAEIVAYVLENRVGNRFEGWIDCLDPRGGVMIADPRDVFDGEYLPGLGNAVPYLPALGENRNALDDQRLKALLDRDPEHRGDGPLPMVKGLPARRSVTPEEEADLLREQAEWNARTPDEKRETRTDR